MNRWKELWADRLANAVLAIACIAIVVVVLRNSGIMEAVNARLEVLLHQPTAEECLDVDRLETSWTSSRGEERVVSVRLDTETYAEFSARHDQSVAERQEKWPKQH